MGFDPGFSVDFHQCISAEFVRDALSDAVALDDISRLDVIRQDHGLLSDGAACLLYRGDCPMPVPFARTEREPRSVGAVKEVTALDPGRDLDLLPSPVTPSGRHPMCLLGGLRQA
jgi:hypothetical protein